MLALVAINIRKYLVTYIVSGKTRSFTFETRYIWFIRSDIEIKRSDFSAVYFN